MQKLFNKLLLASLVYSSAVFAQKTDTAKREMLKNIFYEIKSEKQISYKYIITANFPDGTTQAVKGNVLIDADKKILVNDCSAMTLILTGDWYYNADHREKSVDIVNLKNSKRRIAKEKAQDIAFGNNEIMDVYVDSAILKYGIIKQFIQKGDYVSIAITFPSQISIRSIDMIYDQKRKMPVVYTVKAYFPWPAKGDPRFKGKGTTKTVKCIDYRKDVEKNGYNTDNFFVVNSGIAVLKKYKTYKVKTEL